jgi:hypothetical protein
MGARPVSLDMFLQSDYDGFFWIDSDIVWRHDDFLRLLGHSRLFPVVSAAYPFKDDAGTFVVDGIKPAQGGLAGDEPELAWASPSCSAKSCKRSSQGPEVKHEVSGREMAAVFKVDCEGVRTGEDMAFFADIRACGYKVLLDPEIQLGHVGQKVYTRSLKESLAKKALMKRIHWALILPLLAACADPDSRLRRLRQRTNPSWKRATPGSRCRSMPSWCAMGSGRGTSNAHWDEYRFRNSIAFGW